MIGTWQPEPDLAAQAAQVGAGRSVGHVPVWSHEVLHCERVAQRVPAPVGRDLVHAQQLAQVPTQGGQILTGPDVFRPPQQEV